MAIASTFAARAHAVVLADVHLSERLGTAWRKDASKDT
jgi:hypothetical protein